MADQQVGNQHGLATVHVGATGVASNLSGTATANIGFEEDNMDTIGAMRTRLAAIDGTYYTEARLNNMSYNDLIYAIRVNDHPSTIKQ